MMSKFKFLWQRIGSIIRYTTDTWYTIWLGLLCINVMLGMLLHGDVMLQILTWSGWLFIAFLALRVGQICCQKDYDPKANAESRQYKLRKSLSWMMTVVLILLLFENFFNELKLVAAIATYAYIIATVGITAYNAIANSKKSGQLPAA